MNRKHTVSLLAFLLSMQAWAQEMSLENVIQLAQQKSAQSRINTASYHSGRLDYRVYRASMLPSLGLTATVPNLVRSLDKITLPTGQDEFVQRSQMVSNAGLTLRQPLVWTGGNLEINTTTQRLDIFGNNPSRSYLTNPVSIGLSQPVFGFNSFKWMRKTSPLSLDITTARSVENREDLNMQAVGLYYNWLWAEMQNDMAGHLQKHNDTIFGMSEGRFQMGKIAENDLLQAELNKLNSDISFERSKVELSLSRMRLEQFLNTTLDNSAPVVDTHIIPVQVNLEKAVMLARENLSDYTDYELQQILGERSIAQAQSENRPTFSLFGTYGLTQSGTTFDQSLQNPQESQLLLVRLDVPVYQFGLNRARTEQAKLDQEIRMGQLELQRIALEQNIYQKVTNFMLLQDQVAIARRADEVAEKGYEVTRQRFMIGKIDLLELNNAVSRRTQARMDYVNTLREYWMAYYEIRKLCHYDFRTNTPLTHE